MATGDGVAVLEGSGSRSKGDDCASSVDPLPPRWIAAALSGQGTPSSTKTSTTSSKVDNSSVENNKWAGMRLVDTVLLDSAGNVESWVFTAKTGHVTSKKRAQDRTKIAERFERFALANPRNTERFVALLESASPPGGCNAKERVVLDEKALREALLVGSSEQVPPELKGILRVGDSSVETPSSEEPILDGGPESTRLRSETERALSSLVGFLERRLVSEGSDEGQNHTILECKAEFVVDDNGELWLTSLPSVTVAAEPGRGVEAPPTQQAAPVASSDDRISTEVEKGDDDSGSGRKAEPGSSVHMPPLRGGTANSPQSVAPIDGSGSTPPLGSARRPPTSARSDGQSNWSPPATADNSRPAGRRGSSSRSRNSPRWQLVEGRYKGNLASEEFRKGGGGGGGAVDATLDGMSSPSSFDELSQARLKAYYDEVTVCGNCMEICRKLDSIRASGFPDADGAITNGGVAGAGAGAAPDGDTANVSGVAPPRPSSEPLPESVPALASFSGKERRPGTGTSGTGTDAAGSLLLGDQREPGGDAALGAAPEAESRVAGDGLDEEEGGCILSSCGSARPSPKERPKCTSGGSGSSVEGPALESGTNVSDGGGVLGYENGGVVLRKASE
eukprot:g8318.t2